jgi:hypothetical protein
LLPYDGEKMTERQVNNVLTRQQYCRGAWRKEKAEFGAGNRWLAFNAIQGAEQHRINGRTRGGGYHQDKAFEKAIDNKTPLADRALGLLTV